VSCSTPKTSGLLGEGIARGVPSNKGMKLTKPGRVGASQPIPGVGRNAPTSAGTSVVEVSAEVGHLAAFGQAGRVNLRETAEFCI
jgi:isoaspartyl peptidase/L-asparaginase-like protein (Ntn-hydrolase superfamily)